MKKMLLCAAIAASMATSANAFTYMVTSNVTGLQLWMGQAELLTSEPGGYFTGIQFGGMAADTNYDGYIDSASITMLGEIGFTGGGLPFRLTFNLGAGDFMPGAGVVFSSGTVQVDTYGTDGWLPFQTLDASVSAISFLSGQAYGDGQVSAGIVRNALPGLWDGQINSGGYNHAAGVFELLGLSLGFYMEGEIVPMILDQQPWELPGKFGPIEAPLPAGALLFGSALTALAGTKRARRLRRS